MFILGNVFFKVELPFNYRYIQKHSWSLMPSLFIL